MKLDVPAGVRFCLCAFGLSISSVQPAVVEHSIHPNGPWLPLAGATVTTAEGAQIPPLTFEFIHP